MWKTGKFKNDDEIEKECHEEYLKCTQLTKKDLLDVLKYKINFNGFLQYQNDIYVKVIRNLNYQNEILQNKLDKLQKGSEK